MGWWELVRRQREHFLAQGDKVFVEELSALDAKLRKRYCGPGALAVPKGAQKRQAALCGGEGRGGSGGGLVR